MLPVAVAAVVAVVGLAVGFRLRLVFRDDELFFRAAAGGERRGIKADALETSGHLIISQTPSFSVPTFH